VPDLTERTFSLEPLAHCDHNGCNTPGPPIYLNALGPSGRAAYAQDLEALFPLVDSLRTRVAVARKIGNYHGMFAQCHRRRQSCA
jgi:hypothetical protein